MRWREAAAVALVLAIIVGTPAAVFAYDASLRGGRGEVREITLTGYRGEWTPRVIRVKQGERVRLRITSRDVLHGFQLAEHDIITGEIYPGKFFVAEFVAAKAGTFTFACLTWCSPNHPEMRGELIVEASQ